MHKLMADKRGVFITLEGGEGAGKSTQLEHIKGWLTQAGHQVVSVRQPGGTALSEQIRALLLDNSNHSMRPLAELLLLFADRAQFMDEVVRPALAAGSTVLCDRFTDSTFAYQGGGRGMGRGSIEVLAALVHGDCQPDLTLLLDIDPALGLQRAADRGAANRLEQEPLAFYQRVREAYLSLAAAQPERFAVIDAALSQDAVWEQIAGILQQRLST